MAAKIITISCSKAEAEAWREIFKALDVESYSPTYGFRTVLQLLANTQFKQKKKFPAVAKALMLLEECE